MEQSLYWTILSLGFVFIIWGIDCTEIFEGKEWWKKYFKKLIGLLYFIIGAYIVARLTIL